jgi:HAMP domain-containing protein
VKSFLLVTFLALAVSAPVSRTQSSASAPKTETANASKIEAARQQPAAQDLSSRVPAPRPDDVNSLDAILKAIYDVISGPAGERDWNRFRSLFVPEARLTSATRKDGGPVRLLDVEGYARSAGSYFKTHAFYESAIVNRVQKFGNIAQVFSSYASRTAPNEKPFARGVNSIQLFNDGSRWWVLSILWDEESPANALPPDLATQAK